LLKSEHYFGSGRRPALGVCFIEKISCAKQAQYFINLKQFFHLTEAAEIKGSFQFFSVKSLGLDSSGLVTFLTVTSIELLKPET